MPKLGNSATPPALPVDLATEVPGSVEEQLDALRRRFETQEWSWDIGPQGGHMLTLSTPHTPVLLSSLQSADLINYWTLHYTDLLKGPAVEDNLDLKFLRSKKLLAPNQIFAMVNDIYFQAKQSGENQSMILFGDDAESKYGLALDQFMRIAQLGRTSTKLGDKFEASRDLLNAFGSPYGMVRRGWTECFELQLTKDDGRVHGFCFHALQLDVSVLFRPDTPLPLVFQVLLHGLHPDFQEPLHLREASTSPFAVGMHSPPAPEPMQALFRALDTLGLKERHQQSLYRFLSGLLILGHLSFEDVQGTQARLQESCVVRNPLLLDLAAELLGISSDALEAVLTTHVYRVDPYDRIAECLNAEQATQRVHGIATALYTILFVWVVHFVRHKTASTQLKNVSVWVLPCASTPEIVSSVFDLAGTCMSELLVEYFQEVIFEGRRALMREQDVSLTLPSYEAPQEVLTWLMRSEQGLVALLSRSKSATQLAHDFLHANGGSTRITSVDATHFEIQHAQGRRVRYDCTDWVTQNQSLVHDPLIALFKGGAGEPGSDVVFIRRLFHDDVLQHLRFQKQELNRKSVPSPLSVALAHFDRLLSRLKLSNPRFIFALSHHSTQTSLEMDMHHVRAQFEALQIPALCQCVVQPYYDLYVPMLEMAFYERYACLLPNGQGSLQNLIDRVETWLQGAPHILHGPTRMYLSMRGWQHLEGRLLQLQRKTKRQSRAEKPRVTREYAESVVFSDVASSVASDDADDDDDDASTVAGLGSADLESGLAPPRRPAKPQTETTSKAAHVEEVPMSGQRKRWLLFTWAMTWWIPTSWVRKALRQDREDVLLAWREKTAICCAIFWVCALQMFVIIALGRIICPKQNLLNTEELFYKSSSSLPLVGIYGGVYNLQDFVQMGTFHPKDLLSIYAGLEITSGFPRNPAYYCTYAKKNAPNFPSLFGLTYTQANGTTIQLQHQTFYSTNAYNAQLAIDSELKKRMTAYVGWDPSDVNALCRAELMNPGKLIIVNERVYNFKPYLDTLSTFPQLKDFLPSGVLAYMKANVGKDLSSDTTWMNLWKGDSELRTCFNNLFAVGILDYRKTPRCQVTNYVLLAFSVVLVLVIFVKFLAALQLGRRGEPEGLDKFVILQVPCYTEDEVSLRKTLHSLTALSYDDRRKLLFVVCDGNIIGSGNDRPTPRLVLDILGWGEDDAVPEPEARSFQSLGDGQRQHNMGKIYSGLFQYEGHIVPYIVVVKVGKPSENFRPGNRGKRDSQMILMRFLNKVYTEKPMSPLELDLYHQMKNIIGVNPVYYEFCLMVDADTEVSKDSLNKLVSCMTNDTNVMGCCGETRLANEKDTWATMIQVYEYYISHFMAKAFESLFGSVTCLPGCFCMYRLRSATKNQPVLGATPMVEEYGECQVDTLHKKNLLHLGEDRYLTTLMLKNFPKMKTVFVGDAYCETIAPESWKVLLSQRRRWINSTVHNLAELLNVSELCGFCCFSMRFVVFIDLLATLVQPAIMIYIGYLIYLVITSLQDNDSSQFPLISLVLLAAMYGFQAIVFLLKQEWQHIGWMIIYLLSIPIFSFFIPVYSFWHMDDFSWGNTRVVVGEKGTKHVISADGEKFDLSSIPHQKWEDYEREIKAAEAALATKAQDRRSMVRPLSIQPTIAPMPMASPSLSTPESATRAYARHSVSSESPGGSSANRRSIYAEPPRTRTRTSQVGAQNRLSSASLTSQKATTILPTDEELREEIVRILGSADLMHLTKKQIREELSERFGVNLDLQKKFIHRTIEELLTQYDEV